MGAGVIDVVRHDEVVVGVAHMANHRQFVLQAVDDRGGGGVAVETAHTGAAQLLQIGVAVPAGGVKGGEFYLSEFQLNLTPLSDAQGILHRVGGEEGCHLGGGFEVEFLGFKVEGVGVGEGGAGLDAAQHPLHLGVLLVDVVGIVGTHQRDIELPTQAGEHAVELLLFLEAVVLQLQIEVVGAKYRGVPLHQPSRGGKVRAGDGVGNFACQAGGEGDETLVMLLQ